MYRNQKDFDRWGRFYFDGDGGGGGGLSAEAQAAFDNRLKKLEGNAVGLAQQLFSENYTLREQKRVMEGKLIPDGAIVLAAEEAKAWESYKALGKPEEVKQGLDKTTQLQGELDKVQREAILRKAADAAGFKYTGLVDRDKVARADGKTLAFDVREVERDGKKVPVAFVKDGDTERPLTDYAESEWADFLPVLKAQGGEQQQQQQSSGTRFIGQHSSSGGGGGQKDLVAERQKQMNERNAAATNPLLPKK